MSIKVTGRIIHSEKEGEEGEFQRYGKDDNDFNLSISRLELNKYLISRAEKSGAKIIFDRALQSCRFSGEHRKSLVFKDSKGNTYRRNITCPLIGADGAGSRLRYALRDAGALSFREELCSQGYKEVSFQKNDKMLRSGLHIWPRGVCSSSVVFESGVRARRARILIVSLKYHSLVSLHTQELRNTSKHRYAFPHGTCES